jgi:hypothetical protein
VFAAIRKVFLTLRSASDCRLWETAHLARSYCGKSATVKPHIVFVCALSRNRSAVVKLERVRAAFTYLSRDFDDAAVADESGFDILTEAGLKVVGTTDTAVGEVGVRVALIAESAGFFEINRGQNAVETDGYWGWWKMTPELELAGGVAGTLADSSNTYKDRCKCYYNDTGGDFGNSDPSQIRLTYKSGDISFAVAAEDYDNYGDDSSLGGAAEMKWSGESFGFDLNAGYWDTTAAGNDADWTVNAGAKFELTELASFGVAIGMGEGMDVLKAGRHGANDEYLRASMFVGFELSETIGTEFGVTYTDHDTVGENFTVAGGVYYKPVSQLVVGLEGSYSETESSDADFDREDVKAAIVANYSF